MGNKFEDIGSYVGIVILIIMLIGAGVFIVYERVNRGCWNFGAEKLVEEFEMKDYSCEDLKNILLLEVFPKEIRKEVIHTHCDGEIMRWGDGQKIETSFYYEYDYKDKYKKECLNVEKENKTRSKK